MNRVTQWFDGESKLRSFRVAGWLDSLGFWGGNFENPSEGEKWRSRSGSFGRETAEIVLSYGGISEFGNVKDEKCEFPILPPPSITGRWCILGHATRRHLATCAVPVAGPIMRDNGPYDGLGLSLSPHHSFSFSPSLRRLFIVSAAANTDLFLTRLFPEDR